jgi:hypothetical protein
MPRAVNKADLIDSLAEFVEDLEDHDEGERGGYHRDYEYAAIHPGIVASGVRWRSWRRAGGQSPPAAGDMSRTP